MSDNQLPDDCQPLMNFSNYVMSPAGDVYRVTPPARGRNANQFKRVAPVIHPRGHVWYVQLVADCGKRVRIALAKLQKIT